MSDKRSYLYSTALDRVETESSKLQKDFQTSFEKIKTALLFFDPTTSVFNPQLKEVAVKQNWGRIFLYRNVQGSLQLMDFIGTDFSLGPVLQQKLLRLQDQQVLTATDLKKPEWLQVFFRQGEFYIYGEMQFPYLKEALQNPQLGFYSPAETQWHFPPVFSALSQYNSQLASVLDQKSGVKEIKLGARSYLISFKFVAQINSYVFQVFDKGQVFAVVEKTMNKTLLVSVIILIIGLVAMFFGVDTLTQNLSKLASGMSQFTKSGTARPLKLHSQDEVGKMADVYNSMLAKIESLLAQTAEKARMESELETAKEVQSTLLPKNKVEHDLYNVKGFYKPASECGGDLWYYYCDDKKIFLFVGDATGHGVPAALITAAARSVLSLSVDEDIWDPARILGMLNKVLCDVAKGEKMMTAFACVYDIDQKKLTYSNASHDVPFVVPVVESGTKIKKGDLNFLTEANGKRLGHERSYEYINESLAFTSGQNLLVYTDGLVDAVDKEAKAFSERGVIKMAVDSANKNSQRSLHDQIARRISEYTEGIEQPDDITFVNIFLK
ncbi:SpoIIE family protein phosphatase [Bdellovibrio reynosensis]|uniref:SpoIIE family protein phosphatase n=1 Tax=Bdellovibrio reynosensis TaxID=2835041 RepID=A0ABY4C5E2_9BACT|nr:SpoIIE family protein phosphatase [Bdellovibrio reynosensis]UOF00172.1 SpoIIE family protein phosphatase [Bdellovibrio reynosensis]